MEVLLIAVGIGAVIWWLNSKPRSRHHSPVPEAKLRTSQSRLEPPVHSRVQVTDKQTAVRKSTVPSPALIKSSAKPFEFCAFDTETTGIVPRSRRHRAFELSCVRFTPTGEKTWSKKRFTRYVKVDVSEMKGLKLSPMWESHASTDGQRSAIDAAAALDELHDFVRDLPLVCHNASFDKCVLENEIEKVSHRWRPQNKWICTLLMARSQGMGTFVGYSPGRDDGKSYTLQDVAKSLELTVDPSQLHSGHYDAEIAGTIFLKMHHVKSVPIRHYS